MIPDKGDIVIRTSITLYDQYGNGFREAGVGQMAAIDIGTNVDDDTDNVDVNRNGVATRRKVIKGVTAGAPIEIAYDERPMIDDDDDDVDDEQTGVMAITGDDNMAKDQTVQVVYRADDDNVGAMTVNSIDTDDAEFLAVETPEDGDAPEGSTLVFSYDADDTFVNGVENEDGESEGELLTMEKFEDMLDDFKMEGVRAIVDVVVYDSDGSSIFRVNTASSAPTS